MSAERFEHSSVLPAAAGEVFDWHTRAGAFERLVPPWNDVRVLRTDGVVAPGSRVELEMRVGPLRRRWLAEHTHVEPGRSFVDVQVEGPFAEWRHEHVVEPVDARRARLTDRVAWRLPGGAAGRALGRRWAARELARVFEHRHRVMEEDLARATDARLAVGVTGAGGLIGAALCARLTTEGHRVVRLVRREPRTADEARWSPDGFDPSALAGLDAVVHLAGEGIASRRWSAAQKERIRDSRVRGTRALAEALAGLDAPPPVLVCASAIGFYGERGDAVVDERDAAGDGFLADVARAWEEAADPARAAGARVAHLRFGVVLSPRGGALARMLPAFRAGAGGPVGSGRQLVSWVALDDAVEVARTAVLDAGLEGPVNVVAPVPVANAELGRAVGRALSRPALLPLPAFAARAAFGEMADALLLAGTGVAPRVLAESGYRWREPELDRALARMLGRAPV